MAARTCDLCGTSVLDKPFWPAGGSPPPFNLHDDCVYNRLGFLEEANKNRRSASLIFGEDLANSNLRGEVISFLQSLFKEITEKMCSHTSTSNEAMPEVVVFADGNKDYTASLVVYGRPTDMALECIVCKESLSNDLVYASDVKPDFRFHAKCALEVSWSIKVAARFKDYRVVSQSVVRTHPHPFDPSPAPAPDKLHPSSSHRRLVIRHPSSSHPPPVKRHPSSSPWAKFLALCCVKNSGNKRSTATLPPEKTNMIPGFLPHQ